jgi:SAM-dependent methyltransferase
MSDTPAYDWSGARGEKWLAQLAGTEAMLAPVDAPLIAALRLDAPYRVADVACGGGGTTIEIARRAPAGSRIDGFDISPALVRVAQERRGTEAGDVSFAIANVATAKPVRPYERLASRFGTMFFDDPRTAFANLASWLAPGGRFAFAVWGPLRDNPWLDCARDVVAGLVEMPASVPDAPGPFRYADPSSLLALLADGGFVDIDVSDWRGALRIGGGMAAPEAAAFALSAFSSFRELLTAAGEAAYDAARRSLTERYASCEVQRAVQLSAHVRIVAGTRD